MTLFFVLGKQPFGQFPPGWDVGLEGICVGELFLFLSFGNVHFPLLIKMLMFFCSHALQGERRRVIIPPVLAYGSTGLPRRGIPPDATLQYDITLVSLNGLANI